MSQDFAGADFIAAEVDIVDEVQDVDEQDGADRADADLSEDYFGRGRREYGNTELVAVRCPLFILTAPNVAGCKTTMTISGSGAAGWTLELKLFGNGASLGKKLTVSWSQEVSATAGRRTRVFLPTWVDVQEVTTYFDDGREEQVDYEVRLRPDKMALNRIGVESLSDWTPSNPGSRLIEALLKDYEDTEPVTQGFEYELESSGGFELGFKAFGADQSLKIEATITRSRAFTAELMPGHDYLGSGGVWPPFIYWTVDGGPS